MKKDISKKFFWQLLVLLVIMRLFLVALPMLGLQPGLRFDGGFPTSFTGDEPGYFHVAKNFAELEPKGRTGFGTIGAALVYVPYIWLTDSPEHPFDIYKPVFIVQAFLLYSLSIVFVALIASLILKSRLLGIVTGLFYLLYPYVFYFANAGPLANNNDFMDAAWFRPVMSDAPSAFFVYLGVFLFAYAFFARKKPVQNTILAGLTMGFAALVRFTNILVCAAIGLSQLARKRYKEFALFFTFSLLVFSCQLVYNYSFYGNPFWLSKFDPEWQQNNIARYEESAPLDAIDELGAHPNNYLYMLKLWGEYIPYFELVLAAGISAVVFGFWHFFRQDRRAALFVLFWVLFFGGFYGMFAPAARNIRYWLPVVPAYIILLVAFGNLLAGSINKFYKRIKG